MALMPGKLVTHLPDSFHSSRLDAGVDLVKLGDELPALCGLPYLSWEDLPILIPQPILELLLSIAVARDTTQHTFLVESRSLPSEGCRFSPHCYGQVWLKTNQRRNQPSDTPPLAEKRDDR